MTSAKGAALCLVFLLAACTTPAPPRAEAGGTVCAPPPGPPGPEKATTVAVVERAYACMRREHHGRAAGWAGVERAYRKRGGEDPRVTLEAMVAALGDPHARWVRRPRQPADHHDGDGYGLGLRVNPGGPPGFVTAVEGGAAEAAGLRPGDVVESADGGLDPAYPDARPVRLRLLRQSTGRRWSVTLIPSLYTRDPATLRAVRSRPLDDAVYVRITEFSPASADRALRAITALRAGRTGVVLDLRGARGGVPEEAVRLVSAFVHGRVTAYRCGADGGCEPQRTDDTVGLVGLRPVVLVDGGCASVCEHFAAAVKGLRAGELVGERTAGAVTGTTRDFLLPDNTLLTLPVERHLGPGREVVDGTGVPPDHPVPLTARDVAAGRDPALDRAVALLNGRHP